MRDGRQPRRGLVMTRCSHCSGPVEGAGLPAPCIPEAFMCSEECLHCCGSRCGHVIDLIARLRRLLARCQSGSTRRFPECPVCETKWYDGPVQPHRTGCELAAELPS